MLMRLAVPAMFIVLAVFTAPFTVVAQDTQTQLKQIRQRIESAQSGIAGKQQTEVKLARELALLRATLKRIDERISELRKEQRQLQSQLDQQQQKIQAGKSTLRQAGDRLKKRLVALYKEGEIGILKVLFSADSPSEMSQQFQYLTRILHYDTALLAEYRNALAAEQEQLAELQALKNKHMRLLASEEQQRENANEGRQLQSRLLKKVRRDKEKLKQNVAELQEKAKRLQQLMAGLEKKRQLESSVVTASFTSGKGKLNWPVAGEVLIGFGTKKDPEIGTLYESNGFEISTRTNEPILAVADGRVAFADWFKGYGNLLIVSHPGGYHTLYAQADKLQRSIGEAVKAGDLLGYSGLRGRESIYFEIRHNGVPVDPSKWLKRR